MNAEFTSSALPTRAVLHGVPWIGFYQGGKRCPEDICLPSVMRAIVEYLGDDDLGCKHCLRNTPDCKVFCSYSYFIGMTGAAFYLSWKRGWHEDNQAICYMSDDPTAPDRRAFRAAGYPYRAIQKDNSPDNEARMRQAVIRSIQEGKPVVAYGVIGPPEPCLIAGYDENGDVLIGWNFFQNMPGENEDVDFEPSGYFRKRNWHKNTHHLLLFVEKQAKPAFAESYRESLEWGRVVMRTPMVLPGESAPEEYRQRANGIAAFDLWTEHLLADEAFPENDETIMRHNFNVHNGIVGMVAELRWYGSQFLIGAIDHLPYQATENLLHAAACFAAEHDLMWNLWDLAGGIDNPLGYQKLAIPAIRRQMVPIIQQTRDLDIRAAEYIDRALDRMR